MLSVTDAVGAIPDLNLAQKRAIKTFGVRTIGGLLDILPRRYDDYSNTTLIARAPIGRPVTLKVAVESIENARGFHRRISIIRAKVKDASGRLRVIWFNSPWLLEALKPGKEIFLSGTITFREKFGRQMGNPIWEPADDPTIAGTVAPVYPLKGAVAQKTMRELMASVMAELKDVPDPIGSLLHAHGADHEGGEFRPMSLIEAYRHIHRPSSVEDAEKGRERLAFDEFLVYRLALGEVRRESVEAGAPAVRFDEAFARKFASSLPFPLTDDQKRAAWASFKDMEKTAPMRRLLQGDVGSGKTVVAAFLMAMAWRSEHSAALMAPTEILAKQHAVALRRFFAGPFSGNAPLMLLTSSDKRIWEGGEEKKLKPAEARARIAEGRLLLVGTHALLERDMLPPDAGLVVVDEQHRFGVGQREALAVTPRPDGLVPHLLSMTATPIPRSLALTLYGDLEVSIIRTKPKGRVRIVTRVCVGPEREAAEAMVKREAKADHRTFVICPLVDESDALGVKSATEEAKRLASGPFKGLRIGLLHGRMSAADKDGVMQSFADGLLDVLVSTTVVEVGVDVPDATVIIVEDAERFGLAQLHQLRGRVGRSTHPSFCFLLTETEGSGLDRLKILERTDNGFVIAEEDLKLRGGGELLGMRQAGRMFEVGRITDVPLMLAAKRAAETILTADPDLKSSPVVRERVGQLRETSHQE